VQLQLLLLVSHRCDQMHTYGRTAWMSIGPDVESDFFSAASSSPAVVTCRVQVGADASSYMKSV
jgi:hypothetical protein